jgi:hypothetical protein
MINKAWPDNVFLQQEGKCWDKARRDTIGG